MDAIVLANSSAMPCTFALLRTPANTSMIASHDDVMDHSRVSNFSKNYLMMKNVTIVLSYKNKA